MVINWQSVSKQTFLKNYWQKKPILLKNAIPSEYLDIEPEEVAGLAMEAFIDSRVITNKDEQWHVNHGPFDDYSQFGDKNWSLLVQGADNWIGQVAKLKQVVDFIPKWRIDDIMISFSTPHGGVGAHFDQYDVFIIQGQGIRRWQVGEVDHSLEAREVSQDLLHVAPFTPFIDELVEPGDVLYIPPFAPHQGDTIETSLAFSIGFRSPSSQELLSGFADFTIDENIGLERFVDAEIDKDHLNGGFNLTDLHIAKMQQQVNELVNNKSLFERFLLSRLTSATRELNVEPLEEKYTEEETASLFYNSCTIAKVLGLKTAIYQNSDNYAFYCDGECFELSAQQLDFVTLLANCEEGAEIKLEKAHFCIENNQILTTLINYGYFYIVESDELQGGQG